VGYISTFILIEVGLLTFAFFWGRRSAKPQQKHLVTDSLLLEFFEMKKIENENAEIVRLGMALSTPLWLSNSYLTRKTIGEYIEEAASVTENINASIKVLIDDLGWTNVELGLYQEAEAKLKRGLQLAEENSNGYYLAKGYRHMFGLNYRLGNLEVAEQFLSMAIKLTNSLPADKKKDELIAEIHFAKSSLEHKRGNLDNSLKEIEIAYNMYKQLPDKEWIIKIQSRKGEILLSQNNIEEAIEIFRHGLNDSKKYHFNRQIVKNLIGLGKCYYEKKELKKAKKYFDDAFMIADNIGMFYEKTILLAEMEKYKTNN
jgi:tetratricopeptide (TPR) repeat protein